MGRRRERTESSLQRSAVSLIYAPWAKSDLQGVRTHIDETLKRRENTVMVRINDDALKHLDMLVEAGICKTRSESAALVIDRGVEAMAPLFDRIRGVTDQIHDLREQLKDLLADEPLAGQENASA
jgi:hypothetical protein